MVSPDLTMGTASSVDGFDHSFHLFRGQTQHTRSHFITEIPTVEHAPCMWQRPETELQFLKKVAEPTVCMPAIDALRLLGLM